MSWFNFSKFYNQIAAMPDMNRLVEVGCYKGESISHLAKKLVEFGNPFELFGVDIWIEDNIYSDYKATLIAAGVRNRVSDLRMSSIKASETFPEACLDMVFLDADHRPDAVLADIKAWLPKIRKGGILAGHDYYATTIGYKWGESDNVSEAVNEAVLKNIIPKPDINRNTSVWMTRL